MVSGAARDARPRTGCLARRVPCQSAGLLPRLALCSDRSGRTAAVKPLPPSHQMGRQAWTPTSQVWP